MILAITGGTGFVGRHLLDQALAAGNGVRALTRRDQPPRAGVTWIRGDLADAAALTRLASGAEALIHVAGVVSAPTREGFAAGNIEGARAVLVAAAEAGVRHVVHVSSLAAREPYLSAYGWSKAAGEALVAASPLPFTIVRPPAVFGPGDTEILDLFRMARRRIMPLPPPGRLSVIYGPDLAALLLALATGPGAGATHEADDGSGGWSHAGFARAIGQAVGRRVLPLPLPAPLLRAGAKLDGLLRGADAKLTPDRVAYFLHRDWTIDARRRPPADLWTPAHPTPRALAETAAWYRRHDLL